MASECDNVDSLAQQVEHNTFNVGVLGSSPRRITKRSSHELLFLYTYETKLTTTTLIHSHLRK